MFKKILAVGSALLILAGGAAFILVLDLYIQPKVNTIPVAVAADDINFKDKITDENIRIVNVKRDQLVNEAYSDSEIEEVKDAIEDFKGSHAAIDIKKGTQIYEALIDSYNLIPDKEKGEFIAPIPDEWLFAVPGSLRKSFVADFYLIPDEDQQMIKQIIEENEQKDGDSSKKENGKVMESLGNEPVLRDVRVSSVKDNSNSEVQNVQEKESSKTSTGVISNLEIITTEEKLNTLRKQTDEGYKIYVVYKYER